MTGWEIYWILKLDDLIALFISLGIFALMAFVTSTILHENIKRHKTWVTSTLTTGIIFLTMGTFLPSTKQMAAIIIAPPIINNEKVRQIPNKLLDIFGLTTELLEKKLKEKK